MITFKINGGLSMGEKLAALYDAYRKGDEYALSDAIRMLRPYIRDVAFSGYRETSIPAEEFESYMVEAVYRAFENYVPNGASFVTFLCCYVNKAAADVKTNRVVGGHGTYARKVTLGTATTDGDDETNHDVDTLYNDGSIPRVGGVTIEHNRFCEIEATNDVENYVVNSMTNDCAAEVIASIRERASDKERRILDAVLDAFENGASLNAVAKTLGVSYMTVVSNIRKLARYYDKNRYGDASDYYIRTHRMKKAKKTNGTPVPIAEREGHAE